MFAATRIVLYNWLVLSKGIGEGRVKNRQLDIIDQILTVLGSLLRRWWFGF